MAEGIKWKSKMQIDAEQAAREKAAYLLELQKMLDERVLLKSKLELTGGTPEEIAALVDEVNLIVEEIRNVNNAA